MNKNNNKCKIKRSKDYLMLCNHKQGLINKYKSNKNLKSRIKNKIEINFNLIILTKYSNYQ